MPNDESLYAQRQPAMSISDRRRMQDRDRATFAVLTVRLWVHIVPLY